jgi:hypothetical protein
MLRPVVVLVVTAAVFSSSGCVTGLTASELLGEKRAHAEAVLRKPWRLVEARFARLDDDHGHLEARFEFDDGVTRPLEANASSDTLRLPEPGARKLDSALRFETCARIASSSLSGPRDSELSLDPSALESEPGPDLLVAPIVVLQPERYDQVLVFVPERRSFRGGRIHLGAPLAYHIDTIRVPTDTGRRTTADLIPLPGRIALFAVLCPLTVAIDIVTSPAQVAGVLWYYFWGPVC